MSEILIVGDTLTSADLRHQIPAMVGSPMIFIEKGGRKVVFANHLELSLLDELEGVDVVSFEEIRDWSTPSRAASNWYDDLGRLAVRAGQTQDVRSALTPPRFPLRVAEVLSGAGIDVVVDEEFFAERRRVKTTDQIAGMRRAIQAAESGWNAIRRVLRERPSATAEELHARVLCECPAHGAVPYDIVIVAAGPQSAIGHATGAGAILPGEPVIADLIVRDRRTGVFADVTRTFCAGKPPAELTEYFRVCCEALEVAISAVEPGALAADINALASEIFEHAGYATFRQLQPGATMHDGFCHRLGHGVGLEVHEPPLHGPGAEVPLLEGEVICIEPALYRRGFGGCRIEDMVLVTRDGHERLSQYACTLQP